jgi:hypothetical protein
MKPFSKIITISLAIASMLCFAQCKKDNNNTNPVDQLPPATQTGANTFGCLINGKAFTPGGSALSGPDLFSFYQYLIPNTPAGYDFDVSATDKRNSCNVTGISFGFDSVSMNVGTYRLQLGKNGQGGGRISKGICNGNSGVYNTDDSIGGQLTLTRFDLTYQIASGTFWFNVLDNNGDTIKITDGRFDVHFTE